MYYIEQLCLYLRVHILIYLSVRKACMFGGEPNTGLIHHGATVMFALSVHMYM